VAYRDLVWFKYALAAVIIHAAVLAVPVAQKVTHITKQRVIDIIVMRREEPRAPVPQVEKRPIPSKPVPPTVKEPARVETPSPQNKIIEKKEMPPAGGAGNALDDQMVAEVSPGPATGAGEGVGVAGVNIAGGKVGLGGGGTGTGTGQGSGSGGATTVQTPAGDGGPMEARMGEGDGPQFAYREMPEYPFAARRLGREGRVDLMVTIDEKGKLMKVDVIQATDQTFAQSAVDALKRCRFVPARRKGVPVASRSPYTVRFGLNK
jgi:periplasmic protein TonB